MEKPFTLYVLYPKQEIGFDIQTNYPSIWRIISEIRSLPNWRSPDEILPSEEGAKG